MPDSGYISLSNSSSSTLQSDAATACQSTSSAGNASSTPQQPRENEVGKQYSILYTKPSSNTLKYLSLRLVLDYLNTRNINNVDNEEFSWATTSNRKTEASNPSRSPLDSLSDTSCTPLSSIVSELDYEVPDETHEIFKIFRAIPHELEDVILPEQCAAIEKYVKKGRHLVALAQALRFTCDFAFEGDCKDVFKAGVRVFRMGEADEALGVELWFKKQLSLDFKKYIARRLLRGLLLRYPMRSFPRTFWIAEGDTNLVGNPIILLVNNAVGTRSDAYELGRRIHNILVTQWWHDYLRGLK
ncbi:hypothetical protein F4801DRAFT_583176 [Xylaria longipes]|nr:hypothetical protein F4801DRAFT_583176 [Xylaria longipes]RYC65955.1 hypothetical protein CHU98_g216 [Xylaria longipes]